MSTEIARVMDRIVSCLTRSRRALNRASISSLTGNVEDDCILPALQQLSRAGRVWQTRDAESQEIFYALATERRPSVDRAGLADAEEVPSLRQLLDSAQRHDVSAARALRQHASDNIIRMLKKKSRSQQEYANLIRL